MFILCSGKAPFNTSPNTNDDKEVIKRIISAQYCFNDECWKKISDKAKLLIRNMLESNPSERFSISDVMNSEWMKVLVYN